MLSNLDTVIQYMFVCFQGVALLPFVDERRLRAALSDVYPDLTTEEGEQKPRTLKLCISLLINFCNKRCFSAELITVRHRRVISWSSLKEMVIHDDSDFIEFTEYKDEIIRHICEHMCSIIWLL